MRAFAPVVLISLTVGAVLAPSSASANDSAYTRHVWDKCPEIKGDDSDGVMRRGCVGHAGIRVVWYAGDASSAIEFGDKPLDEILDFGSFFEVRDTIEWRMTAPGRRPFAAIVRYATGQWVGRLDGSRLVVYRLAEDGRSCVVGSVNGRAANANEQARALADAHAPSFQCGRSARR